MDAVRLYKNGFPEHLNFGEFWRKFRVLDENFGSKKKADPGFSEMKSAVEELLENLELDKSTVRLGNTQIFLRSGVLSHLEEERDEKMTDQIVKFQAVCREHLARRRFQKLKVF